MPKSLKARKSPPCQACRKFGHGKFPRSHDPKYATRKKYLSIESPPPAKFISLQEARSRDLDRESSVDIFLDTDELGRSFHKRLARLGMEIGTAWYHLVHTYGVYGTKAGLRAYLPVAVEMRSAIRQSVGSILLALKALDNEALRIFNVTDKRWRIPAEGLQKFEPIEVERMFKADLDTHGIARLPGFLVGFINAEFDPASATYHVRISGIGSSDKVRALRDLEGDCRGFEQTRKNPTPIVVEEIVNRANQLSVLLDVDWARNKRNSDGSNVACSKSDPIHIYHYAYDVLSLIWLAKRSFSDLQFAHGCRFLPCGHLKIE